MRPLQRVTALLVLIVALTSVLVTGEIPGGAVAASPIGDAQGRALLARVHIAYLRAAGVELSVLSRGARVSSFGRFLVHLRGGVDVAEEFVGSGPGATELVARQGGPTYVRDAGQKCWRPLAASDPRTLVDVGLPYPYSNRPSKVMPLRHTATGWVLSTENRENFWFLATQPTYHPIAKRFMTYTIDAKSLLITSIDIQALQNGTSSIHAQKHPRPIWLTARLQAKTLTTPPLVASAKPTC
jgi:hypothetical protein